MVTVIIYMVFSFNNSSAQSNSSILIENELEKVYKPSGPDVDVFIEGTFQNDNLRGGPGNQHISGGKRDDKILGNDGDDILEGGDGDNILEGGPGKDKQEGGKGADLFICDEADRSIDFDSED